MSTNKELKLKLDEMSIELDVVRKVEASLVVAVVKMGASISHFGNIANYTHSSEGTQTYVLASTYMHYMDWVIDLETSKHVTGESHSFITYTPYAHLETI
jgi:hypothetical protein